MVCSWRKYINSLKQCDHFKSPEAVYRDSESTSKKVLALLKANPKNDAERDSFKYIQQYMRGLEQVQLLKFLRFCNWREHYQWCHNDISELYKDLRLSTSTGGTYMWITFWASKQLQKFLWAERRISTSVEW